MNSCVYHRLPARARYALRFCVSMLIAISLVMPQPAFAISNPFFVAKQISFSDLSAFTKWTGIMPRYETQHAARKSEKWETLLSSLKGKPTAEKMRAVNDFFNEVTYVEDIKNFGQQDFWQTPYEFMDKGGDCEDYAIAKYISLKRLGVAESSMRIMIVQDNNLGGIMHAVLEVRDGNTRYILDNQVKSVTNQANIFHYRPIYAINTQAWWAYQ